LLGKYFSGQATEGEAETVKSWIHASHENTAEFNMLQKLWDESEKHRIVSFDTEKAWQKVNAKINVPLKKGKVISFKWKAFVAVAASLVLVLAVWWMMSDKTDTHAILAKTDAQEVQLPDGSKVYLRKGSTLEYPETFGKDRREVSLSGEAFFEVTPNPSRPFGITAADAYVKVVGTSFSVNTANDGVRLIVKTGKVNFGPVADTSLKFLVTAGERAHLVGNKITKEADIDINSTAWVSKQLVFKNTPLQEIAATLSDYYKVKIALRQDDAAQIATDSVTIRFDNQPLEAVLNELSLTTTYHIQETSKGNYIISIK
jgi:ferric-dicitrate binding protein FerR (iron transport regulator)